MATMTVAQLGAELIRIARIGPNVSSTVLAAWLNEAIDRFQYDTKILESTRYYYVREYFSPGTDEGFGVRLTAATGTNLVVRLDSGYTNINGATFAEALSTALVALATGSQVTFSTSNFKFTVDISSNASTGFYLGPPDYSTSAVYSNLYKVFGIDNLTSVDAQTYTGAVSPWCTSEYPLPDGFMGVKEVRYGNNKYPLSPCVYKNRNYGTGVPNSYYIRGKYIGFVPQPTDGGTVIQLDYYTMPAEISVGDQQPFGEEYDYAIIYYAAYLYKLHQEDNTGMLKFKSLYEEMRLKAIQQKGARIGAPQDLFGRGRGYDPNRYPIRRT